MTKFKYFAILCAFLCASCSNSGTERSLEFYYDIDCVIVAMNGDSQGITQDKFRQPERCQEYLFYYPEKDVYTQMSSCDGYDMRKIYIQTNEFYYNHDVGSKVHFDYIKRDRFFKITK